MQMLIGQIASAPAAQQTTGKGTAAQPAAAGFGGLLVQTVAAAQQGTATPTAAAAQNAGLTGLLGADLTQLLGTFDADAADAKLTELIAKLEQGGGDTPPDESDVSAMEELLTQFDALIASILGVTAQQPAPVRNAASQEGEQQEGGKTEGADPAAAVRANLQQVLGQLQTIIKQGGKTIVPQEQLAEVGKQLAKLSDILQVNTQRAVDRHRDPGASPDSDPAVIVSVQTTSGAAVHLQRLNKGFSPMQTVHAAAQEAGTAAQAAEAQETQPPVQQVWLSSLQQVEASAKTAVDGAKQPVPQVHVQQLTEALAGMAVKQFGITKADGMTEARISLLPEHLGQLDVRIAMHNGQLTAHFTAESAAAKDMLENQLAQLRTALQAQGLQVDKLEVTQNPLQGGQMFQEQRRQGSGAFSQSKQGKAGDEAVDEVLQGFEKELVEQAVVKGLGYGRAVNITA